MAEKIKNMFTLPVSITASIGIITIAGLIMAFAFNYFPPGEKELSASPIRDACEYRVGAVEDRCDKMENAIEGLDTKLNLVIEILRGKNK